MDTLQFCSRTIGQFATSIEEQLDMVHQHNYGGGIAQLWYNVVNISNGLMRTADGGFYPEYDGHRFLDREYLTELIRWVNGDYATRGFYDPHITIQVIEIWIQYLRRVEADINSFIRSYSNDDTENTGTNESGSESDYSSEQSQEDINDRDMMEKVCFKDALYRKCYESSCNRKEYHKLFRLWHPDTSPLHLNVRSKNFCFNKIKNRYDAL
jgi:hypothetical protein